MEKLRLKKEDDANEIKESDIVEDINSVLDCLSVRSSRDFEGKAIYLSDEWDYVLGKDDIGAIILVPLKKK